ncbi:TIR domain-containing protein [Paenibacillus silvisoli]|uniref:TIR domain-containing protein n=1 Tax=Paenibacillus silvisoli TaxID=3110539 RepID=UPI0038992980
MDAKQLTYKLYISRSWNHSFAFNELDNLFHSINQSSGGENDCFSFQLAPSPEYKGRRRYELIREKMRECDAVIVLCGVYNSYSDWISKEIVASKHELNKPIIAIRLYKERTISPMIKKHADRIVELNADQILDAISEFIDRS